MKAEIITIGTELLLGQIVNTNAAFLSQELAALGIEIYHHTSVGDNPKRLDKTISQAEERADMLIFSGGLGPTKDDITKPVVADHLNIELIDDKESTKYIEDFYSNADLSMPQSNYNQAQLLEGSERLPNDNGMAPGVFLEYNDHIYVMLPGVPNEMMAMVNNHLVPKLRKNILEDQVLESRILRFFGTTESQLAEDLDEIIENQTNPTVAIYVDDQELTVRLTANAFTHEEAQRLIDEEEEKIQVLVSDYFFGYGTKRLPEVVNEILDESNKTISFTEGVTGGQVLNSFTNHLDNDSLFKGGLVFNDSSLIEKTLGLSKTTIDEHGISSSEAAIEIARKSREYFDSQIAISVTGISFNNDVEKNLPTEFWIGVSFGDNVFAKCFDFSHRRNRSRNLVLLNVMNLVRRTLLGETIENISKE